MKIVVVVEHADSNNAQQDLVFETRDDRNIEVSIGGNSVTVNPKDLERAVKAVTEE